MCRMNRVSLAVALKKKKKKNHKHKAHTIKRIFLYDDDACTCNFISAELWYN